MNNIKHPSSFRDPEKDPSITDISYETQKEYRQIIDMNARLRALLFPPPRGGLGQVNWIELCTSFIGAFLGIGAISSLAEYYEIPLLAGSFGASAVLLYAAPGASMAQPRNAIGGHIISSIFGVFVYKHMGFHWYSLALAVAGAIVLMMVSRTLHPPGGATAFIAVHVGAEKLGWSFVSTPIGLGIIILVSIALITNRLSESRKYPTFWI